MLQPNGELTQEQKEALELINRQLQESEQEEAAVVTQAQKDFGTNVAAVIWMSNHTWQVQFSDLIDGYGYALYHFEQEAV